MTEWFASYNGVEQMFLLAGIVGGIILVFRLILTVAGSIITVASMRFTSTATAGSRR